MAESTVFRVTKDATITLTDGSSPQKGCTLRIHSGAVTFTAGGANIVRAMSTTGRFLGGPRDGGQAGVSTVQVEVMVYEIDDGTDIAQADIFRQFFPTGSAAVAMVTAGDSPDFVELDFALALAAVGDNPAKTISLSNCLCQPGWSLAAARDGFKLSATFESPDLEPTYA